jgi:hypothetical protein
LSGILRKSGLARTLALPHNRAADLGKLAEVIVSYIARHTQDAAVSGQALIDKRHSCMVRV